jgi:uncharacterized protein (DUF488 family)
LTDFAQKVQNDTKLYEDEAAERGMDVEQYMKVRQAEQIITQNKRNEEQMQRNQMVENHVRNLVTQSEAMKELFPGFNLEAELQNNNFKRLVDPPELGGAGIPVKDAFFALHHNEIMKQTTANAVNQAQISIANTVKANRERPQENGLSKAPAVIVKDDPSKFTLEDFHKIKEQMLLTGKGLTF